MCTRRLSGVFVQDQGVREQRAQAADEFPVGGRILVSVSVYGARIVRSCSC